MSVILRCNVFPVVYQASRRSLCCNLYNLTRRSIALSSETSNQNEMKISEDKKVNLDFLHQYLKLMQGNSYERLLRGRDIQQMRKAVFENATLTNMQALLFLKCCGNVAIDVKPENRRIYLNQIWDLIKKSGIPLDVSHYNAFLKSQIENEDVLSYENFINDMESNGITPNRVTYQNFLTYYCYNGELAKATRILEIMKEKDVHLNEHIFNALILGHAVTNDINGAEDLFQIMKDKNLAIDSTTYFMYVCGLACSANLNKITEILEECSSKNIVFSTNRKFEIIYYLIINGHKDYALKMLEEMNAVDDSKEEIILQYRLLHKKEIKTLVDVLNIISSSVDLEERLKIAYFYLEKNEDLLTTLQFKHICEEKGLRTNLMAYWGRNYDVGNISIGNLKEVVDYCKAKGGVDFFVFHPFLRRGIERRNVEEIIEILKTMRSCNISISHSYLKNNIVKKVIIPEKKITSFIGSMSEAGMSYNFISGVYYSVALDNGDITLLNTLLESCLFPKNLTNITQNLIEAVNNGYVTCVALCLKAWYCRVIRTQHRLNLEAPVVDNTEHCFELSQEDSEQFADNLIKIFTNCKAESLDGFLKELINIKIPISPEVVASIKNSWQNEKTKELIDCLRTSAFTLEDLKTCPNKVISYKRDEINVHEKKVKALIRSGNLTEAEEQLQGNESFNTYNCYRLLIEELLKVGEEQKVVDLLKKCHNISDVLPQRNISDIFLECEMIKRKMIQEAKDLAQRRRLYFRPEHMKLLAPLLNNLSDEHLSQLLNNRGYREFFNFEKLVYNGLELEEDDLALRIINLGYEKRVVSLKFIGYSVYPYLYSAKKLDIIRKLHENFKDLQICQISYSLCMEDISSFYLSSESNIGFNIVRFVDGIINTTEKCKLIEKLLENGKNINFLNKNLLYEILIENYKKNNIEPKKCLELWYDQQEENLQPTQLFLIHLSDVLKTNNIPVEFHVPQVKSSLCFDIDEYPSWFPKYVKHCLNRLPNYDTEEKQFLSLIGLVREGILNLEIVKYLIKMFAEDNRALNVLKKIEKHCHLRIAFFKNEILPYFTRNNIKTCDDIREGQAVFLASLYTNRLMSKKISEIVLWFYWSKIKPCPELVEIIKPKRLTNRTISYLNNMNVTQMIPFKARNMFDEFMQETIFNESLHFRDENSYENEARFSEDTDEMSLINHLKTDVKDIDDFNDTTLNDSHKS